MITRIVKMTFDPEKLDEFLKFFESSKAKIQSFEGCCKVDLMQDVAQSNQLYTISIWEDERYLNKYRSSEFFSQTWTYTKSLFADKASAVTLEKIA